MDYVRQFEEYYNVPRIQQAYDAGEHLIIDTYNSFNDIMGGNALEAMEEIEWDLGICLEVSDYMDVVIHGGY